MIARPSLFPLAIILLSLCGRQRQSQYVSGFVLPSSPASSQPTSTSSAAIIATNQPFSSLFSNTKLQATTSSSDDSSSVEATTISKAPTLNGKMVLPVKAMTAGLGGHKVAAVYAILDSSYKRGSGEGWEHVQHVGITRDLNADITYFLSQKGSNSVAHVRALSFSYPQKATMMDFAEGWKAKIMEATGGASGIGDGWGMVPKVEEAAVNGSASDALTATVATTATTQEGGNTIITVGDDYEFDEDDEDMDEDDLDDYLQMMAESRAAVSSPPPPPPAPLFVDNTGLSNIVSLGGAVEKEEVISPFEKSVEAASAAVQSTFDSDEPLEMNVENVDRVLDEVRPYLISDGGNVSVQNVDVEKGDIYLLLEGACGSCSSSTVTMKMGIERVLKEKFGDKLGEVIQVEPEDGAEGGSPTELTIEAVQAEVDRIATAIIAMGGVVRVVSVDSELGVVEVDFRGPNRVRKGLELALLDVEYVKHVKFVSE